MKFNLKIVIVCLITLFTFVLSQTEPVFQEITELFISLRFNRADVLFSEKFDKYKSEFDRLKTGNNQKVSTPDQLVNLNQLKLNLEQLNNQAESLKPYFSDILEVRDDALENGANDFAPATFGDAEESLVNLVQKSVDKIPNDFENRKDEVLAKFRKAQFETIGNNLLSEVRILIKESEDLNASKYAPQTYNRVKNLLMEVNTILDNREYDNPELKEKAARLSQESSHLLSIVQLAQKIRNSDDALEAYILDLENNIDQIAKPLDYQPEFSSGLKKALENLTRLVDQQQAMNESLSKRVKILSDSVKFLHDENLRLQGQLQNRLDLAEQTKKLNEQLSPFGIKTLQENSHITLRFNGIRFDFGKIQINAQSRAILEKIGIALRSLAVSRIKVTLGQSSGGNFQYSKSLAEQRANAVALVIQTTSYLPTNKITTEGIIMDSPLDTGHAIVDVILEFD
jgi:outer membrane protein OmpA-like peptidoglycan-associated protein